jgi:spore coat polysaccharide biosynthesis protein SpsF
MKSGLILSIREKSTRYPGKVLKQMLGQTVTEHLIDRMKMAGNHDHLVIGTSDDPRDRVFADMAGKKEVDIYYGDREDKLLRYHQVCDHFSLDGVVIVDGDDILCFPEIMNETISKLEQGNADAVFWKDLPLGAAPSGLTANALKRVLELKDERDTEVWGGYFIDSGKFNTMICRSPEEILNKPEIRLTMDYPEDFELIRKIFEILYVKDPRFSSSDLMQLLDTHPEWNEINKKAQEKYLEHISRAKPVKFKNDGES